ncbi:NAD(P)/FAD-dependent oxidoreductase [Flammeovirga sp. SJP92]|uniref:phytoene desaturase family protein n=1 Tax=Flammeovirga sp. SJP92 TaxID=1775430 RepID=UPI0007889BE2|nr:phytoene desaturase family protein [Flammeovirga sp. SJP92]KXX72451.1 phytoene dehydrogenase [Flammeovirga sp. SJP92]
MASIGIIGSGFSGLSAAITLADQGHEVHVYEKNEQIGGRARTKTINDFTFDLGPSWYWMPDVFENFFGKFGKKVSDYYELERLDPSYRIYWSSTDYTDIPADVNKLGDLFEEWETGAKQKLMQFMHEAEIKYQIGMNDFVHRPSYSIMEFAEWQVIKNIPRLHLISDFASYIRKYFKNEKILKILEFPVLFLGDVAKRTPALYSLMNYADLKLGTWYPKGGLGMVIKGFESLAIEKGVTFHTATPIDKVNCEGRTVISMESNGKNLQHDEWVGTCDYNFFEQKLLPKQYRNYTKEYWDNRKMAPSCLLYYIGLDTKFDNIHHHNLYFDTPFEPHAEEIYDHPAWPKKPLFYMCAPSVSDNTISPEGTENLMLLIPVAPGLEDTEEIKEHYFNVICDRLKSSTGIDIREHLIVKETFAHNDFVEAYNAFKGNAYGLSNVLKQTAFLKPSIRFKKLDNILMAGQLTVPGPGVPPSIISGELVAREILKKKGLKAPEKVV